jgi:hypothetical protein
MSAYKIISNNYLAHHGIKGQRWGRRRYQNEDGSLTVTGKSRYTSKQFNRDKGVYGKSTAKRFAKKLNNDKNQSIQGLRSKEADRIDKFRKVAKAAGALGSMGGAVGGYLAGKAIINNLKYKKHVATYGANKMFATVAVTNPMVKAYVPVGAGAVGSILGKIGTESLVMAIGGYSPLKLRK